MKKILLILALVVYSFSTYAQERTENKNIDRVEAIINSLKNGTKAKDLLQELTSLKIDIKNQDSIYRVEIDSLKEINNSLSNQLEVYNILNNENIFDPKNIKKLEALDTAQSKVLIDIINLKGSVDEMINKIEELKKFKYPNEKEQKKFIYAQLKDDIYKLREIFKDINNNSFLISNKQKAWYDKNVREIFNTRILDYLGL